jgi:hypothetical protein
VSSTRYVVAVREDRQDAVLTSDGVRTARRHRDARRRVLAVVDEADACAICALDVGIAVGCISIFGNCDFDASDDITGRRTGTAFEALDIVVRGRTIGLEREVLADIGAGGGGVAVAVLDGRDQHDEVIGA